MIENLKLFNSHVPGSLLVSVPRSAGLLRGPVPGEGRHPDGAGHQGPSQVLAQDLFTKRGYVSW